MDLSGIHVPLITPFDERGEVAYPALEKLAHDVREAGAHLVALGTTAEAGSLTGAERRRVLDLLDRTNLIVGADTPDQLREAGGARAALTLVPPFVRPGEEGVIRHFEALAASSPIPLIVYHVPQRTGQPLTGDTIRRLAAIDGVIGIKYATGVIDTDLVDLLADPPDGFAILCGDDVFLAPMLAMGAHGGILASAHLATERFVRFQREREIAEGHRLARLSTALFAQPNPTVVKAALHAAGRIPTPGVRLPLLPALAPSFYGSLLE
ncbi:4-hydroxy-tetrahydrodipicolinate synthase 2 [Actinoplanes sp. OR16]|uniref:dihydrodipicolinate synthase family protein n=1 Tax=Actinoplanes sp. OR16 TaxID=946334 RepID=UPI000F70C041|nr:dihydrodipicolinate synthase family protein [Actinoplanes sp. OR16]BBH69581.1 4-hydroxy-tetrahydrodipicolinate synthase 2 [Actinoplanes sp. OR16]